MTRTRLIAAAAVLALLVASPAAPANKDIERLAVQIATLQGQLAEVQRALPRNLTLRWQAAPTTVGVDSYRFLYALEDKPIITGTSLIDAQAQLDPLTNGAIVVFELDRAGGRKFGAETGRHVGDFMAILLDDQVQGAPPVIQSRIDRRGQITLGNKTLQEAQDLALTLKAGALPVPLKIVEEQQVSATLGADSIRQGVTAGVIGTVLVVLIMVGYYRMAGALAIGALALYILFTLGGLSMLGPPPRRRPAIWSTPAGISAAIAPGGPSGRSAG